MPTPDERREMRRNLSRRYAPGRPLPRPRPESAIASTVPVAHASVLEYDGLTFEQLLEVVAEAADANTPLTATVTARVKGHGGELDVSGPVQRLIIERPEPTPEAVLMQEALNPDPNGPRDDAPPADADAVKVTTLTINTSPESTEDAVARGLRDMEARRAAAAQKRPGILNWK